MGDHIETVEANIDALGPDFFNKYDIALKLSEIEEIPESDFSTIQRDLHEGRSFARQSPFGMGISKPTFELFASPSHSQFVNILGIGTWLVPIIAVLASILAGNWWWLLLLFFPIFAIKRIKSIYLEALFDAAGASEKAFCFAFTSDLISYETPDGIIRRRGREAA